MDPAGLGRAIFCGVGGLAALILAGWLFVIGATGIARAFGVHAYAIGAIIVAVGTSLPELMAVLHSRLRGHDEVGVGTLLGSNLFNGWAIVGVAASLHPITTPVLELAPAIDFDVLAILFDDPRRSRCHHAHAGCAVAGRSRRLLPASFPYSRSCAAKLARPGCEGFTRRCGDEVTNFSLCCATRSGRLNDMR